MTGRDRGRLTPVDVVFISVAVAALAFLAEPFYTVLGSSSLSTETELMFKMLPPALIATVLYVTYRISLLGSGQA